MASLTWSTSWRRTAPSPSKSKYSKQSFRRTLTISQYITWIYVIRIIEWRQNQATPHLPLSFVKIDTPRTKSGSETRPINNACKRWEKQCQEHSKSRCSVFNVPTPLVSKTSNNRSITPQNKPWSRHLDRCKAEYTLGENAILNDNTSSIEATCRISLVKHQIHHNYSWASVPFYCRTAGYVNDYLPWRRRQKVRPNGLNFAFIFKFILFHQSCS